LTSVDGWSVLLGGAAGVGLLWLGMLIALLAMKPDGVAGREVLRLLPDVLRLLRRLTFDSTLPRGVRLRLLLGLTYLAVPFDLIPDFVPVLGVADDVIVVAVVLRSVVRRAGPDALSAHWAGSPQGLAAVHRLCGLPPPLV
jgi:uncharacterized membrane protein YkvA (DUF1232 family)